jgi:hypothetical protein
MIAVTTVFDFAQCPFQLFSYIISRFVNVKYINMNNELIGDENIFI